MFLLNCSNSQGIRHSRPFNINEEIIQFPNSSFLPNATTVNCHLAIVLTLFIPWFVVLAAYIKVLNYSCINKPTRNVWTENVTIISRRCWHQSGSQLWCSLPYSVLNNSMPLPGHLDLFTMETDGSLAHRSPWSS